MIVVQEKQVEHDTTHVVSIVDTVKQAYMLG